MGSIRFCSCKRCKKARKKGQVLGSRWAHYWTFGGLMKVSDYVPYHRWQKGRRPTTSMSYEIGNY